MAAEGEVVVTVGESSLVDWSMAGSLALVFPKSRSAGYEPAVRIARRADRYAEVVMGKSVQHFAGFGRTLEQATAARTVLRYMRSVKGFQCFASGSDVQDWWRADKVLDCYLAALKCKDPRAHCVVMVDEESLFRAHPRGSVTLSIGPSAPLSAPADLEWFTRIGQVGFPCRFVLDRGFRFQKGHPSSHADQLQAGAVREGCDWCPNFNTGNLS